MVLRFNSNGMFKAIVDEALIPAANRLMQDFIQDVKSNMKRNSEGKDYDIEPAVHDEASNIIKAKCTFYAKAIMESYGRGEGISEDNPDLADYIANKLDWDWNIKRDSVKKTIMGREEGPYIDIFGNEVKSKGKYAGGKAPGFAGKNIIANLAIQNAMKRLVRDTDKVIENYVSDFFDETDLSVFFDDKH